MPDGRSLLRPAARPPEIHRLTQTIPEPEVFLQPTGNHHRASGSGSRQRAREMWRLPSASQRS